MTGSGLRILFVSHSFPLPDDPLSNVGGMQRVATALYRTLRGRDDITVVPLLLETSWKMTGIRTGPFLASLVRRIPRIVREQKIDVVLFSSMVTASVVSLIGKQVQRAGAVTAAIPVGRDVTLPNPLYQKLVPGVLRRLDFVFPISRATAAECIVRGADPAKVHIIPCGVDPVAGAALDRPSARARLHELVRSRGVVIPEDLLVLLSVGRHQERKGFHWFVDAVMPSLADRTVYLLAGSGPMTPTIEERVRARQLTSRVILLGQVSEEELAMLYAGSDLFVMPNVSVPGDIEGFGVVMLEAGAAGLPVIAARLEGIQDVVAEGVSGRLVESTDAEGFIAAIDAYRDGEVLATASREARAHVESEFGWPAVAQQFVEILSEKAGSRASAAAENGRKAG